MLTHRSGNGRLHPIQQGQDVAPDPSRVQRRAFVFPTHDTFMVHDAVPNGVDRQSINNWHERAQAPSSDEFNRLRQVAQLKRPIDNVFKTSIHSRIWLRRPIVVAPLRPRHRRLSRRRPPHT